MTTPTLERRHEALMMASIDASRLAEEMQRDARQAHEFTFRCMEYGYDDQAAEEQCHAAAVYRSAREQFERMRVLEVLEREAWNAWMVERWGA